MAQPDAYRGALEAVDRILNREPEADEVLRQTVAVLHDRIDDFAWVGLSFVEEGELVLGPRQGDEGAGTEAIEIPVVYQGGHMANLGVRSNRAFTTEDRGFLERVALLISAHCLVGWDTGGVPWSDVG